MKSHGKNSTCFCGIVCLISLNNLSLFIFLQMSFLSSWYFFVRKEKYFKIWKISLKLNLACSAYENYIIRSKCTVLRKYVKGIIYLLFITSFKSFRIWNLKKRSITILTSVNFFSDVEVFWQVAISNSTDTNSKPSETWQILISKHLNINLHKLESFLLGNITH